MKGKSLKLKVKSYSEKLFTFHFSLFTDKRGFTLIEVIMIIVVVAIAIPALLIILGQEAKQSVNAELMVSATNVAQALMEEIKSKDFATVSTYNGYSDTVMQFTRNVEVCYVCGDTTPNPPCAAINLNACLLPPTTTDYKKIKVTTFNPTLGSVELVTVVTNY